ncbi:MAG: cytochrome c biogenesis protein ResB [Chloroflexota bacterium]
MSSSDRSRDRELRDNPPLMSSSPLEPLSQMGGAAWRLLSNVQFAVLLISLLAMAGLIGMLVRQFPVTLGDDPARYAAEVANMHRLWGGLQPFGLPLGSFLVDTFNRFGFFSVFSTAWFLLLVTVLTLSITVCTLDRTSRLWRGVRHVRVAQPKPFFAPHLAHRAVVDVPDGRGDTELAVARAFRSRGFRRQQSASVDGGATIIYGDRNQYMKMSTLLTHAGLVLFFVGAGITVAFGFETIVFVGEGQTAPVQQIGTPDNMLLRNYDFEAPQRADGSFIDFSTDLGVFRNGEEIARKTIRVNDPLEIEGFVFHQNTFGPAVDLTIRDADERLVWTGPLLLDGELLGRPQGFKTIPGSDVGLLTVLNRDASGEPQLVLQGIGAIDQTTGEGETLFLVALPLGVTTDPEVTAGHSITWDKVGAWTGIVVKNDPGQPFIWVAFTLLIVGLSLSFYFPRRRAWARIEGSNIAVAFSADRYVDQENESSRLVEAVARATDGIIRADGDGTDQKRAQTGSGA